MARKAANRLMIWSFVMILVFGFFGFIYPTVDIRPGYRFDVVLRKLDHVRVGSSGSLTAVSTEPFLLYSELTQEKMQGLYVQKDDGHVYFLEYEFEYGERLSLEEGSSLNLQILTDKDTIMAFEKGFWSIMDQALGLFIGLIALWLSVSVAAANNAIKKADDGIEKSLEEMVPAVE